jgi:hypothetical protein
MTDKVHFLVWWLIALPVLVWWAWALLEWWFWWYRRCQCRQCRQCRELQKQAVNDLKEEGKR